VWDGPTFQSYYLQVDRLVGNLLAKEPRDYLLNVDPEAYLEHLVEEIAWQPLEWDESQRTIEPFIVKRERPGDFGRSYVFDEDGFRLRIPISAHPQRNDYFKFGPSTTWAGRAEPKWKFEGNVLILEVEATAEAVERGLEAVRFWLSGRNRDIEAGNQQLRSRIQAVWERRRRQIEEQAAAVQATVQRLNIPLHQDPNATVKPVEVKPRQIRTVVGRPKATARAEPTLDRADVSALVDFIDQYARQFELTPRPYASMDEEALRDLLIGMMNANYPGSSTGETFSKLGKADITLRIDTGHVLICECKFWSGAKAYGEALKQLFGYLTWRQNYGVLITFCKLRDMTQAVANARSAVSQDSSYAPNSLHDESDSRFVSRHSHPQDTGKAVEIHHLFFDLST